MIYATTVLLLAMLAPAPTPVDSWAHTIKPPSPTDEIAARIAECESGNRLTAKNPTSSASGAWQFIDSTWEWVTGLEPPASAYPRHVQRAAFDKLWDDGNGRSHWAPSSACWSTNSEGHNK